jgi:16S rRNA C967 or C1407 C5-methylase (RsmB/RsmF family)
MHTDFSIDNASKYIHRDLVNEDGCIEIFPHKNGIDGSFAARLVKNKAN